MTAIASKEGSLIKILATEPGEGNYGFHRIFGFISESALEERIKLRKGRGLAANGGWLCRFQVQGGSVAAIEGCQVEKDEGTPTGAWKLLTSFGQFLVSENPLNETAVVGMDRAEQEGRDRLYTYASLALAAIALMILLFSPRREQEAAAPEILEPVAVKIVKEVQKAVTVPAPMMMSKEVIQQNTSQVAKRAIQQNLGFLGLLGRKDLKKALGGAPTSLKDASPGAGAGGLEGSGGELLVGLGQGVKRTTVGNSGVAGLGGIGSKGAGGGAGGYGNSMIGSGEGKALSSIPLSQDMVLEGGLDRSVIQATIAKYLSQVRACYEDGLRKVPGISGTVTMGFEVGPSGALNYSHVNKSTLGNSEVEGCIANRMMGWKFPKPLGGVNVKVNYPFLLRPVGT